jgi:predicted negative regulator of RcsB-dependent stress response
VDEDLSELERLEAAKKWWLENYKSILLGALIAVVVVGGWRYWQHRTQVRNEAASTLNDDMVKALQKHDDAAVLKTGGDIIKQYGDTVYATHAALAVAQVQAAANKYPESELALQWAIDHGQDPGLQMLARLRLGRVQLAAGDAKGALATLDTPDAGGFAPLFDELRGDIEVKLGDTGKARAAYKQALDAWSDTLGDKSLLQMKLDSLPAAPAAAPAPASKASKP